MRSTRSLRCLGAVGLTITLAAGCGAINGEHLTGTGGHGAGGTGGATSTGGAGGQGATPACGCVTLYDPVCGTNGVTYANSCVADCSSVKIAYQGPCVDGGTGGASGTCNVDSDCFLQSVGCCGQTCTATVLLEPPVICNVACVAPSPPPACACVNHQCINAGGGAGGSSGAAGSSGTADGGGGANCGELADAYAAALPAAERCDVGDKSACQTLVSDVLSPCGGCSTYVNDATTLSSIQAAWLQQKCNDVPVLCPEISCELPTSGSCVAGDSGQGRCQPNLGVLPN